MVFNSRLLGAMCASIAFISLSANAAVVTLADYLVTPNPGDSWTYRTNMDSTIEFPSGTVFYPAGAEFTVTEPWYVGYPFPVTAETGIAILVEPNISMYLDIIPELTVPEGTFNNVLQMTWLDSNFIANSVNTDLGIDPLIDEGVTDVNWFALGVGEIKFMGVDANTGTLDGGYDLISYSFVPVPAAVWLFGSGLIGLIGVARRKKA